MVLPSIFLYLLAFHPAPSQFVMRALLLTSYRDIDRFMDGSVGNQREHGALAAALHPMVDSLTMLDYLETYPLRTNVHPRSEAFDLMKARFESPLQRALL